MSEEALSSLLGTPVRANGTSLGNVRSVLVDGRGAALGFEVATPRGQGRFLPFPAALVADGAIETSHHALLRADEVTFYERRGARRIGRT
jgi:hypothetical protein